MSKNDADKDAEAGGEPAMSEWMKVMLGEIERKEAEEEEAEEEFARRGGQATGGDSDG